MTMTIDHPRFQEFIDRLTGPEGCNFRDDAATWDCGGGSDKTKSTAILRDMGFGFDVILSSFAYFAARGAHCDCEIVLDLFPTAAEEDLADILAATDYDAHEEWCRCLREQPRADR
jgi:hypothetical protein